MRFRRKAKLFPGVYLNFSKTGISTTIGVPGASVNIGKKGTYLNTGIPGTGLYDRQKLSGKQSKQPNPKSQEEFQEETPQFNEEIGAIKTGEAEATTTKSLDGLKQTLLVCYQERIDLTKEIKSGKTSLLFATILMVISYLLLFGFFIKWFKTNRKDKKEYLEDLKLQLENCLVNIDMEVDETIDEVYKDLIINYKELLKCEKIWDITSSVDNDQKATRSAASKTVTRRIVKFGFDNIDIIKSKYEALHFENANGGDLFIYPAFIAIVDAQKKFGLVDIRELKFNFRGQRFLEEEKVPKDTLIVDKTWAKVNKSGTKDKRFKDNYEIPVVKYGEIELSSSTGLDEAYSFSSYDKSLAFAEKMVEYGNLI